MPAFGSLPASTKRRSPPRRTARRRSEWYWRRLVQRWAENKSRRGVLFFGSQNSVILCPRLPRNPPQFHHTLTTFCRRTFAQPPSKTPAKAGCFLRSTTQKNSVLSRHLFGLHPEFADRDQDDKHDGAEREDLAHADVLGEEARQDQSRDLGGEDNGHKRRADALHQFRE